MRMVLSSRLHLVWIAVVLNSACYGSNGGDDDSASGGAPNAGAGGVGQAGAGGVVSSGGGGASNGGAIAKAGSTAVGGTGAAAGAAGSLNGCVDTPTDVAADEITALGFSANDVLAKAGGTHTTDLLWLASDLYATHSRGGTVTPLTLVFADAPGSVRYIDSQGGGCSGGAGPCWTCQSRMEIDLELQLTSGDGALDELVTVTLEVLSLDAPAFSANVAATDLSGSYLDGIVPDAGYSLTGIHLEVGYGVGFSGSHVTVPDTWNGFVAATLRASGSVGDVLQAHGYFPKETGM